MTDTLDVPDGMALLCQACGWRPDGNLMVGVVKAHFETNTTPATSASTSSRSAPAATRRCASNTTTPGGTTSSATGAAGPARSAGR